MALLQQNSNTSASNLNNETAINIDSNIFISIFTLIEPSYNTFYIYECDINSTLVQVIHSTQSDPNRQLRLSQFLMSILTSNKKETLYLNDKQIYIDSLYKIHPSIRAGKPLSIRYQCSSPSKIGAMLTILLPRQSISDERQRPKDIHPSLIKYSRNKISKTVDPTLLLSTTRFIELSLTMLHPSQFNRILNNIAMSYIWGLSQATPISKRILLQSIKNCFKRNYFYGLAIIEYGLIENLEDMVHPRASHDVSRYVSYICCEISHYFPEILRNWRLRLLIKHLSIFICEECDLILQNTLDAFQIIFEICHGKTDVIQRIIHNGFAEDVMEFHDGQGSQNDLLVSGYISECFGVISRDVTRIIWGFFNPYKTSKVFHLTQRLSFLINEQYGYSSSVRNKAASILNKIGKYESIGAGINEETDSSDLVYLDNIGYKEHLNFLRQVVSEGISQLSVEIQTQYTISQKISNILFTRSTFQYAEREHTLKSERVEHTRLLGNAKAYHNAQSSIYVQQMGELHAYLQELRRLGLTLK